MTIRPYDFWVNDGNGDYLFIPKHGQSLPILVFELIGAKLSRSPADQIRPALVQFLDSLFVAA